MSQPAQLIPAMLSALSCAGAVEGRSLYVSTPITTGQAWVQWRQGTASQLKTEAELVASHTTNVVEPNLRRAADVVSRIRELSVKPVIDPTLLLDIPGWKQRDYHSFWVAVIDKFAEEVVFLDGWQYSTGCVIEYRAASSRGIHCLTETGVPLDSARARELISEALKDAESLGVRREDLRTALLELSQRACAGA